MTQTAKTIGRRELLRGGGVAALAVAGAAVVPPHWRALAYATALAFGAAVGILRMAAGAHFFTDWVFAGVFSFLVIWFVHGWLYRWPRTRTSDETVERALERIEVKRT